MKTMSALPDSGAKLSWPMGTSFIYALLPAQAAKKNESMRTTENCLFIFPSNERVGHPTLSGFGTVNSHP